MSFLKGSFKNKLGFWWIACWECKQGINGNQKCQTGLFAKSLKVGCYEGELLEKYYET